MKVHIHSCVSEYTRNSRFNTGYSYPGSNRLKKDNIFKETADFIAQASYQRKRLEQRLKQGAKILPCL